MWRHTYSACLVYLLNFETKRNCNYMEHNSLMDASRLSVHKQITHLVMDRKQFNPSPSICLYLALDLFLMSQG
jgi:hypothetical protein